VHPYKTYSFTSPNPVEIEQLSYSAADLTSIVIDYCDSTITYDKWDAQGNLIENHIVNGIYTNYIWGYNNTHPIAETKNATATECGYTGFENNESNSFPIPEYADFKYVDDAFSGRVALKVGSEYGPGTSFEVKTNADNHSGYKASVWVKGPEEAYLHIQVNEDWDKSVRMHNPKGNDDWHLLEVELPRVKYESDISSTLNIRVYIGVEGSSGIAYFDDLRFYPMDAQMTTYTYDPLIGVTSMSDVNNKPTTYEYDGLGRLVLTRDYLGDILKKYVYHYKTP
jgi:YD repeat-containing protein